MKRFFLFLCFPVLVALISCSDDDKVDPPAPEYEVTVSDLKFVSGEYLGETSETGVAEYTIALSSDYDKKLVTRSTVTEELSAKDVIYLTIYSDMPSHPENAFPAEGKYEVKDNGEVMTVNKGKGSYITSTIYEQATETAITGGFIEISYKDGNTIIKLEIEDDGDVLNKYKDENKTLTYTGKGTFKNESGLEYFNFTPESGGSNYTRIWYWGEASDHRGSVDGELLGEYLFEVSNTTGGDVNADGQAYLSFYLMDEFQLYGMDGVINPGVYPVEALKDDGFKGKKGTIYLPDLEDPNARYRGVPGVTIRKDGVSEYRIIECGNMTVIGDEEGNAVKYLFDFICQDGYMFYGKYEENIRVRDEWTVSDFREDVSQENLVDAYMRLRDPQWRYEQAGTNHWEMFLMGEGVSVALGDYGVNIYGPGDCFRFEVSTATSAVDGIPAGTYEIKNSYEAGVAQQGDKSAGYIGIYNGAWFHRIDGNNNPAGMGLSGTLTIGKAGNEYTIETTFQDDAKNTFIGKYKGVPTIVDTRSSSSGAPVFTPSHAVKEAPAGSAEYLNARAARTENAKAKMEK